MTKKQARHFLLEHQGINSKEILLGKSGILAYMERVRCIQYDPLNIVGTNPDLVLQARIDDYNAKMLQQLLYEDRLLIDGWDKNMSIYLTQDWPYFKRFRDQNKTKYTDPSRGMEAIFPQIRKNIQQHGPMSSLQINIGDKVSWGFSSTKTSSAAMEMMYYWGELGIDHRVHTRRMYQFMEKLLPQPLYTASDPNETEQQYHDWYVHRRLSSVGMLWSKGSDAWLGMGFKAKERKDAMNRLHQQDKVMEVEVEGITSPFYIPRMYKEIVMEMQDGKGEQQHKKASIIAPLDNLIWDRKLIRALFDFEYVWEVYKPVKDRKYGYYVLPVLYGDTFIARFEPGWDKESGTLIVKNWWWEDNVSFSKELFERLQHCFHQFAHQLGANDMTYSGEEMTSMTWLNNLAKKVDS